MSDTENIPAFAYRGQQMRRAQLAHVRIGQELRDCAGQGALDILVALLDDDDDVRALLATDRADLRELTPPEPDNEPATPAPAKRRK